MSGYVGGFFGDSIFDRPSDLPPIPVSWAYEGEGTWIQRRDDGSILLAHVANGRGVATWETFGGRSCSHRWQPAGAGRMGLMESCRLCRSIRATFNTRF